MRAAALSMLLMACGAEDASARLRPIVLRTEGLPDLPHGWFDVELQSECTVAVAADGERRCLPSMLPTHAGLHTDPACAEPMYLTPTCDPAPGTAWAWRALPVDRCPPSIEVVRLERDPRDPRMAPLFWLTRGPDGTERCEPAPDELAAPFRERLPRRQVWRAREVVPPSRFVRIVGEERGAGTPKLIADVAEDGTRMPRELRDGSDQPCELAAFEHGAHCLANVGTPTHTYSDDACSVPLYATAYEPCTTENARPALLVETFGACLAPLPSARFFATGPSASDGFVQFDATRCVGTSSIASRSVRQGAPIEPSSLPRVELRREGASRLKAFAMYDDQGRRLGVERYWDDELGIPCSPRRVAEGSDWRCLPVVDALSMFGDATCQDPLLWTSCGALAAGALVTMLPYDELEPLCTYPVVRRVGDKLADGALYDLAHVYQGIACKPFSEVRFDARDQPRFRVGAEVPLASFALFTRE